MANLYHIGGWWVNPIFRFAETLAFKGACAVYLYTMKAAMTKSLEDYLEAIHRQIKESGSARVVDIARTLGVKMPSVNNAVKELAKLGYVEYERYQDIRITDKGLRRAASIFRRHTLLKDFLMSLGVSAGTAERDACAMEHILSEETMEKFKDQMRAEAKLTGGEAL